MDADVQEFIAERFVPVWVDDREDAKFASGTLKLSDQGYPNVALYDAEGQYFGRLIGFGGLDPWFAGLKEAVDTGSRLKDLRARAAADPAAGGALAKALSGIPDMEEAALAAYAGVPAEKRDAALVRDETALKGRVAWEKLSRGLNESFNRLLEGVDRSDREAMREAVGKAFQTMAPRVVEAVDSFLKEFPSVDQVADAMLTKASVLLRAEKPRECVAAAKAFLEKFPDHRAAPSARAMIEQAEMRLAESGGGGAEKAPEAPK